MQIQTKVITSISNNGHDPSSFAERSVELSGSSNWMLSEQQPALNFRLRSSASPYQSNWHVAGDPTLLIILGGAIEIELRDGSAKIFHVGDMFIAEDYLADGAVFDQSMGHRARVVGSDELNALHLKLSRL